MKGRLVKEPLVSAREYKQILKIIKEAQQSAQERCYWVSTDESLDVCRKKFIIVAQKEGIPLLARKIKNERRLELTFPGKSKCRLLDQNQYKEAILEILAGQEPKRRKDILAEGRLSPSMWTSALRQLKEQGKVQQDGRLYRLVRRIK